MDRQTCGELFNQLQEGIDRLSDAMLEDSKAQRHLDNARRELNDLAKWMGFNFITVQEFERRRAGARPKLRPVK